MAGSYIHGLGVSSVNSYRHDWRIRVKAICVWTNNSISNNKTLEIILFDDQVS